ncbi:hypothetical protein EOA33_14345 [Mesorhizobium sp. M4A.F.Ca.ET.050.02.1.1]|uniref:hypothetical protein n=1 Tax=Mesorhizobium sp. M4A.F.Ca.ET.050.02.1.1 TaxID=2496754 RepID=UPI000FCC9816|nr:hypothetical protein [Mesorhizobium sp. M4A.F.Ca.ET.050.02.1.1]RUX48855.1 hypothetical protein EOA33_14345 [Mesorhizobium sp. M4A.F.Ca.ET.050.02.1.1]TIT95681.1 MAG: hypothetical protein E5W59_01375 [Mesorhizobium sp.]
MTDATGIAHALEKKASWRREKAQRHPEDVRNIEAAEMLESLAAQAEAGDIDPELSDRLTAMQNEGDEADERANELMTAIGFSQRYEKIDHLIRDIVTD